MLSKLHRREIYRRRTIYAARFPSDKHTGKTECHSTMNSELLSFLSRVRFSARDPVSRRTYSARAPRLSWLELYRSSRPVTQSLPFPYSSKARGVTSPARRTDLER